LELKVQEFDDLWQVVTSLKKPLVKGITKFRPALGHHLMHPYFGSALNLGLYQNEASTQVSPRAPLF
jgi:hypothetical protein